MAKMLLILYALFSNGYFAESCGLYNYQITCQTYYNQLASLSSTVCRNVARNNITVVNSCINCFSSAISSQVQPSLIQMSTCASSYLTGTNYSACASALRNDALSLAGVSTSGCQTGYCNFVRCLRRTNSNLLVGFHSMISACYNQVAAANNATNDAGRVLLYTNVTSCILARARCSPINPITGQPQNNRFTTVTTNCLRRTTTVTSLVNALQITPNGDLRVIALPGSTTVASQLCPTSTSLSQSGFTNVTCT